MMERFRSGFEGASGAASSCVAALGVEASSNIEDGARSPSSGGFSMAGLRFK